MSLVLIEGIDRTGKTSVAKYFQSKGFELIHLSAPKEISSDAYLGEMVDILSSAAAKDVVLDRSHYGEILWPKIYNRPSLLSDSDIEALREIEDQVGVKRILMTDPQVEQHWKRCVANNEPLTKQQFVKARTLYSSMAHKYGFELVTLPAFLKEFPDAQELITLSSDISAPQQTSDPLLGTTGTETISTSSGPKVGARGLTAEQLKLERANAINEILSKRLLKQRGEAFDNLEGEIRGFLNTKLGQLLGGEADLQLSKEEVIFYRTMYKNAMKKER